MSFVRMPLEDWFDEFQYEVDYDIGESAVGFRTFAEPELDLRGSTCVTDTTAGCLRCEKSSPTTTWGALPTMF